MEAKKLFNVILVLMIVTAIIVTLAIKVFGQEQRIVPKSNWRYQNFDNFSNGLNLVDHPTTLNEGELLSAQNLIYQGKNLIGRPGWMSLDTTFSSPVTNRNIKGITRVYLKDGTKKIYVALGESLYVSNAAETEFTALTGGIIDSTEYPEFLTWNDTTHFVDGAKFWKIVGTTIVEATTVDSGRISALPEIVSVLSDTVNFTITDKNLAVYSISQGITGNLTNPLRVWIGKPFNVSDTARALVFPDLLTQFQLGDTIISAKLSLYVSGEHSVEDETLTVKRNATIPQEPVRWSNKPAMVGNNFDSVAITGTGITVDLNLRVWVDSVINRGLTNTGLQLYLKDEIDTANGKLFDCGIFSTQPMKLQVRRVPKLQISTLKPNQLIDTTKAGIWIDNEFTGYFIEFPDEAQNSLNRWRLITGNIFDTLFFTPRLTISNLVGKSYRIVAKPSSIEKVYPTGANPNKIDTVGVNGTTGFADSTRRVWLGAQTDLSDDTLSDQGGVWFLKIVAGKGVGDYQILDNEDLVGQDYVVIFNSAINLFDTTSRFEIYRRVFPSPEHFTVNKSRFWFSDSLHFGRLWFSEVNRPAQVGALNFHTVGGDPSEGEITYLGGLYVSNFAEPQNPLVIGRENSVYMEFDDNPRLDYPRKIVSNIGISSARAVIPISAGLFHNYRSRYYFFDGRNEQWISPKLGTPFDDSLGISDEVSAFLHNQVIYTNIPNKDSSYSFDVTRGVWTGKHTFGFSVATSQQGARDTTPVYFAAFQKAKVRNFGRSASDNDNAITGKFQTPYYNLGQPEIIKQLREFVIDYSTQVSTWTGYSAGFGDSAVINVIFYAKDDALSGASTDSIRIKTSASADWSTKKHLTGASWGKNFSFIVKSDNVSGYRVGRVALGMELFPNIGAGGN